MKITLNVDTNNPAFPKNGIAIVQAELSRRIGRKLPEADVVVKPASTNGLKFDGMKETQQKIVKTLVEEMFEESDQWLVSDI